MGWFLKRRSVLPGFGLAMGFTISYLCLIVLIPLGALVLKSATLGLSGFWDAGILGPPTCRHKTEDDRAASPLDPEAARD